MADKNIGLLQAIEIAIEAELKAKKFYLDAVQKTTNDRGKDMLQQLANFEHNHYMKLTELKKSLQQDGEFIEYEGTEFEPYKGKVSSEVQGNIEQNKDDVLKILSMAIDAETKAYQHYKKMAADTSDPKGVAMFEKLSEEEALHRRILSDEFYQLSNRGGIWFWGD